MRPPILVTLDEGSDLRRGVSFPTITAKRAYAEAVTRAGGLPLFVAPDLEQVDPMLAACRGVVITGGAFDIDPALSGARADGRIDAPKPTRTAFEWALFRGALARGLPVLGICGGMQLINVALGGTLLGDIRAEVEGGLEHEQASSPALPDHAVAIDPIAARFVTLPAEIRVNTTHHQAVARLGAGVLALGRAPDGVVELIAREGSPWVVGAQWHPELLDDEASHSLYGRFIAEAISAR